MNLQAGSTDQDEIVRYLLGRMDEEARSALEDCIVGDDDLFELVVITEGELLDAYARGDMPSDDRARLDSGVLATPEGQSRLAFARALANRVSSESRALAEGTTGVSPLSRIADWIGSNRTLTLAAVTAAAIALVALMLWISVQRNRPIAKPEQAQQEPAGAPNGGGVEPPRVTNENVPSAIANTNTPPSNETSPSHRSGQQDSVIAFLFAPQTTRGVEELRVLHVPVDVATLRLRLDMVATGTGPYTAILRTADGKPVLRRSGLAARRTANGLRVTLDIPADGLAEDEYNLSLVEPEGEDVVADYLFRIERR